jgi:hypothetical protein
MVIPKKPLFCLGKVIPSDAHPVKIPDRGDADADHGGLPEQRGQVRGWQSILLAPISVIFRIPEDNDSSNHTFPTKLKSRRCNRTKNTNTTMA